MSNVLKKVSFIFSIFAISLLSLGSFVTFANAQQSNAVEDQPELPVAESISSYKTDITINKDASLKVVENITYNFGVLERHGIFRDIPYKYKAQGGTFKLRISDISVLMDKDESVPFSKSTSGNNIQLKIGDADKTISGTHNYKISYTVRRAINYFDDHDELYWNAIGSGWTVPIEKSEVVVRAPSSISKMACYTGADGSKEQSCSISGGNSALVTYNATRVLQEGEGFTIVAGMPVGTVDKPTTFQKFWDIFIDNGILLLPIIVLLLMLYFWNRFGKDAKSKNSIVAQYEAPDKMSALYMGTLTHNKTENKDIAAELIYLAANGFITIKRIETTKLLVFKGTDYEFTELDKSTTGLRPQSKALLDAMFTGGLSTSKLSDLKSDTTFGKALLDIKSATVSELVKDGYFKANPTLVQSLWFIGGIMFAFGGSVLFANLTGYLGVITSILSGIIIVAFSFIMPAVTQKGADTIALIDGLKDYLTVAEKDRLNFHNAPEKNPQHFEALLPFAIALGVEVAWASQFKDLTNAPSWYNDGSGATFNALVFTHAMSDFSSSVQTAAAYTSSASSGGSGFSGGGGGGGFGGGGGGSW